MRMCMLVFSRVRWAHSSRPAGQLSETDPGPLQWRRLCDVPYGQFVWLPVRHLPPQLAMAAVV